MNKSIHYAIVVTLSLFSNIAKPTSHEKPIYIVTASYNNQEWYQRNLDSVFNQNYQNWHLIYVDDCSPDNTGELVEQYINATQFGSHVTLIKNTTRRGALYNQYHATHACPDNAIIIILDGDDWFSNNNVLSYINNVYANPRIWLTYGQFKEYPSGTMGFCCPMPEHIIKNNKFREFQHIPSHLRTYYAWLFKRINVEDLMYKGDFFKMTGDIAVMFPLIEMARHSHFTFIPEVLLTYNGHNPINDHKISKELQRSIDLELRSRPRYPKVFDIGLLIVATGKYIQFVQPFIESARTHFCKNHKVTYYVFTDGEVAPANDIVVVPQQKLGWPYDTMMRWEMYHSITQQLAHLDYIFACDSDMLWVADTEDSMLSDRVGTLHPGYVNQRGTYETNPISTAYVDSQKATHYFAGGFVGGSAYEFLKMAQTIVDNIRKDLQIGHIALWHDESHVNRYFFDNHPTATLTPSYCYPESWDLPYQKRLLALDKNHKSMRK